MKAWTDLNSDEKISRSSIGSALCFLLAAVIAVCMCIGVSNANKIKERCTVETQGKVVSVHTVSKYNHQPYLYASYTVDGREYHTKGEYSSDDGINIFGTGKETVPVYYDPDDPSIAYACDSPRRPNVAVWFILSAMFIAGGCLFIWQAKTIKREPDITDTEIINRMNKAGIIHIKAEGEPKNNDEECD